MCVGKYNSYNNFEINVQHKMLLWNKLLSVGKRHIIILFGRVFTKKNRIVLFWCDYWTGYTVDHLLFWKPMETIAQERDKNWVVEPPASCMYTQFGS